MTDATDKTMVEAVVRITQLAAQNKDANQVNARQFDVSCNKLLDKEIP